MTVRVKGLIQSSNIQRKEQPSRRTMLALFSCYSNGSSYDADGEDSKN